MNRTRSIISYIALLITTMACAALFYPQFSLNHDSSWYLVATRMFLEGKQLYVDVVEINPPLAFYITAPALYLADLTGFQDTAAFLLVIIALGGISTYWLMKIVLRSTLTAQEQAVFIVGSMIGIFVLPANAFGQREHLLLIFALPYLCYLLLGERRGPSALTEKLGLGLVAMLGLALKPYFLAIPALIILAGPIKQLISRISDPANLGLAASLIAYFLLILAVHPEYFSRVLPVATQVYASFGLEPRAVLLRPETFALVFFGAVYLLRGAATDNVSIRLLGAIAGSLVSYLVQFKGWDYQILPFSFLVMLGTTWTVGAKSAVARKDALLSVLAIFALFFSLGFQILRGPYRSSTSAVFSQYVEQPGESILVLSTNVSASFPFVNEVQGRWSSRYPAQWHIPGALVAKAATDCSTKPDRCTALDQILTNARKATIADIANYRPELVIIDVRKEKSYFEGLPFEYLEFLGEDSAFQRTWTRYEMVDRVTGYEIWRRRHTLQDGPSPVNNPAGGQGAL